MGVFLMSEVPLYAGVGGGECARVRARRRPQVRDVVPVFLPPSLSASLCPAFSRAALTLGFSLAVRDGTPRKDVEGVGW